MKGIKLPYDIDDLQEDINYDGELYLDDEWMQEMNRVHVIAPGLNVSFSRPGHVLEIRVTKQ